MVSETLQQVKQEKQAVTKGHLGPSGERLLDSRARLAELFHHTDTLERLIADKSANSASSNESKTFAQNMLSMLETARRSVADCFALSLTSFIFSSNFSQTRGTPKKAVGRTALSVMGRLPLSASGRAK